MTLGRERVAPSFHSLGEAPLEADDGDGGVLNLAIEVKGEERESDRVKRAYSEDYWTPAVNAHGEFRDMGRWAYLYVTRPDELDEMIDKAKLGESQ